MALPKQIQIYPTTKLVFEAEPYYSGSIEGFVYSDGVSSHFLYVLSRAGVSFVSKSDANKASNVHLYKARTDRKEAFILEGTVNARGYIEFRNITGMSVRPIDSFNKDEYELFT